MPANRPAIPSKLRRDVLLEAGHRCAIPTCKYPTVEIAHIVPWATVRRHDFSNLIALCPTCHARFDRGEIDRRSMMQYKANLSVLNSRYGDLERRVLQWFADDPTREIIEVLGNMELLLLYLIRDGYLNPLPKKSALFVSQGMMEQPYQITEAGREFVARWITNDPLDADQV